MTDAYDNVTSKALFLSIGRVLVLYNSLLENSIEELHSTK